MDFVMRDGSCDGRKRSGGEAPGQIHADDLARRSGSTSSKKRPVALDDGFSTNHPDAI